MIHAGYDLATAVTVVLAWTDGFDPLRPSTEVQRLRHQGILAEGVGGESPRSVAPLSMATSVQFSMAANMGISVEISIGGGRSDGRSISP